MFQPQERTAVFSLALILAFRMLGLFVIIPVFSPYLQSLSNATPLLIGLTMGIYGLTQALFQIPLGILSDYIGRKEVITLGLLVFFIGSIVAASTENIYFIMLGRALQGCGAISGSTIALLSDLTTEDSRTRAMAVIGVSIGAAFMMAFIIGPFLSTVITVNNIFYLVAFLVLPILFILWYITPDTTHTTHTQKNQGSINQINQINYSLIKLVKLHSFGVFTLHGILMANFLAIPIILKTLNVIGSEQGFYYIAVFMIAVIFMGPLLMIAERKKYQQEIIIFAVLLIIIAQIIFWFLNAKFWGIIIGLIFFFTGFNILEASLPSLISKIAPKNNKGAVMGMYSTAQFIGPMLGGALAGILFKYYGLVSIFVFSFFWASLWFLNLLSKYKY